MSVLIFLLSIAAIFTYCTEMTDTHILPKWLCTLGMVAVVGMIEGLFILSGKQRRMKGLSSFTAVAFLCLCQAVYAIMQAVGIMPSRFSYQVVGSFDNPAGLVANMCPVRFVPLHSLLKLYQQMGNTVQTDSMAQKIIDKPVKISSVEVEKIKAEARKWLKR